MPGRGARRGDQRGRNTGRFTASVALLLALLFVGEASAGNERMLPWSGGTSRVTPIERALSGVAASLAGSGATVRCASPGRWRALGVHDDFDAAGTWAMTPLAGEPGSAARPEGYSTLAPRTCRLLAAFTAVSMTIVTVGFGVTLSVRPVATASATLVPVLGTLSLAFGLWYAAAAWALAPYPL